MKKIVMFGHGGSGNHGCEALVRSTCKVLNNVDKKEVFSNRPHEDIEYGVDKICKVNPLIYKMKYPLIEKGILKLKNLYTGKNYNWVNKFKKFFGECDEDTIALSIGGDNYCYPNGITRKRMPGLNQNAKNKGAKTVLWGCSIEPNFLNDEMARELDNYNLITTRETITKEKLEEKGLGEKTKLYADTAFQLDKVNLPLPDGFIENNTIGLNLSPLVQRREKKKGIAYNNFSKLIDNIIEKTDMNIALIPHVVWKHNNDLIPLNNFYQKYKDTQRVVLIEDHNCMELKGFISRLKMFIGARTHATIAAYSTNVPTLAIGYSVKAKGIAKDLFGSYEDLVLPVQDLKEENELINGFNYLWDNQDSLKKQLEKIIPEYSKKVLNTNDDIQKLFSS